MNFLTLRLTKRRKRQREEQKHNPTSKIFLKPQEKFSLVTLITIITNYHFYHLWSDTEENLKNKNWC